MQSKVLIHSNYKGFFAAQSLFGGDIFAVSKYLLPVEGTLPRLQSGQNFSKSWNLGFFLAQFPRFYPQ